MLPGGWQHSADEAVTVVGDGTGLHVLAASEASGYAWKSVATLGDPAVQTNLWIGQDCVADSGNEAVVAYAPEQVTNMAGAQGELGRAAVVNLRTGAVRDLGGGYSIAYFDPGCGIGGTAVLTEGGWADDTSSAPATTTLAVVDTAEGKITSKVRMAGLVTSAVPYQGQIVAAAGKGLEEIGAGGTTRLLTATDTVPFELSPDASGGLGYETVAGKNVDLWHMAGGSTQHVASVLKGAAELRQTGGRVWLVGPDASKVHGMPAQWQPMDAPAASQPSTTGTLAVTNAAPLNPVNGQKADPTAPAPAGINVQLLEGSRQSASFEVPTFAAPPLSSAASHTSDSPSGHAAHPATAGSPTTPVSPDRTCAIALNDPNVQAYQPTFQQVEWAVDQAAQGTLTTPRPAGLYGSSLPSYSPQGWFPLPPAEYPNQPSGIPAQVLLGVLTQESNLQQASQHVIQGQTSNPLTSFNWYGNWTANDTVNTGEINWANSDCGYGIGQITTGMCLSQPRNGDSQCTYAAPLAPDAQLAIAVDYQANIAAAAQRLVNAWNELESDNIHLTINYDPAYNLGASDSDFIDAWYDALWDYNSGIEPGTAALGNTTGCIPGPSCTDGAGNWGLGYADNPENPAYPPDRPTFATSSHSNYPAPGGATYSLNWDLAHPQYWPYQDKVLAYAFDSVTLYDYSQGKDVQAFAFAHGNYTSPPPDLWCTAANHCNASNINETVPTGPDPCLLTGAYVDHCWWNGTTASWYVVSPNSSCSNCGLGVLTYAAGTAEPTAEPIAAKFAQTCASGLTAGAVIVGDGGKSALGCPGQNWTSAGSFSWNFAADANGLDSSKIDFDQIGAGFGGHFWFGYTVSNDGSSVSSPNPVSSEQNRVITGTWTPPSSVTGWTDIKVAIPSYGAQATAADYRIDPGSGALGRNVQVNQSLIPGYNTWIDLGDYDLSAGAHVSLSNVVNALSSIGVDMAWSAMAFIPISAPSIGYVAMGDSYSSGEGVEPYIDGTDTSTDTCHRSTLAYPELVTLPGQTEPISQEAGDEFDFIACSGAETTGVSTAAINPVANPNPIYPASEQILNTNGNTDWGYEQYKTPWQNTNGPVEGMQAGNPVLDSSSTLVTISIGGNDSRFGDVITGCVLAAFNVFGIGKDDCSSSTWTLQRTISKATDPNPLYQFEPTVIQLLAQHLLQTYLDINGKAPKASIVVVGYPQLFPSNPTGTCDSDSYLGKSAALSIGTQTMINSFASQLNSAISTAVTAAQVNGVAIHFVNPTSAFLGHGLCDTGTPWIQPLQIVSNRAGSYHPNQQGQAEYATLVNQCLAGSLKC